MSGGDAFSVKANSSVPERADARPLHDEAADAAHPASRPFDASFSLPAVPQLQRAHIRPSLPAPTPALGLDFQRAAVSVGSPPPVSLVRDVLTLQGFEVLSARPLIMTKRDFLSESECQAVLAESKLQRFAASAVHTARDVGGTRDRAPSASLDKSFVNDSLRSSETGTLTTKTLALIRKRVGEVMHTDLSYFESPMSLVRYRKGGFFTLHVDADTDVTKGLDRVYTFLLYLNTLPADAGGATVFPHAHALKDTPARIHDRTGDKTSSSGSGNGKSEQQEQKTGLRIEPRAAQVIVWANMTDSGRVDRLTSHCSEKITADVEKFVVNIWIHTTPQTQVD